VDGRNTITSRRDEYGGNPHGLCRVSTASRPGVAGCRGGDARERGVPRERGVAVRGGTMFARSSLFWICDLICCSKWNWPSRS
jgi:hypothetical protein